MTSPNSKRVYIMKNTFDEELAEVNQNPTIIGTGIREIVIENLKIARRVKNIVGPLLFSDAGMGYEVAFVPLSMGSVPEKMEQYIYLDFDSDILHTQMRNTKLFFKRHPRVLQGLVGFGVGLFIGYLLRKR